jgi:hypothetical protein
MGGPPPPEVRFLERVSRGVAQGRHHSRVEQAEVPMHFRYRLALLTALPLLICGSAAAQTKDENYSYHFDDELLVGDTLATTPPLLRVRPGVGHVTLIRPRASFVPELLVSVQAL